MPQMSQFDSEVKNVLGDLHINPQNKTVKRGEFEYEFFHDARETVFSARVTHVPTFETVTGVVNTREEIQGLVQRLEAELSGKINQVLKSLDLQGVNILFISSKPKL